MNKACLSSFKQSTQIYSAFLLNQIKVSSKRNLLPRQGSAGSNLSLISKYNCWSCGRKLSDQESRKFFCPCEKKKIIPVPIKNTNYFDLFDLKAHYNIDKKNLTKSFRQLMRKLHPDLFHQSSELERTYSAEQSSLVNKAYRVLSNPIDRALYLLEINNVHFEKESVETGGQSSELLMSVLELNEQLNEIESKTQVGEFESELQRILSPLEDELDAAFQQRDFGKAVNVVSKMKYFRNIDERLQDLKLKFDLNEKD